MQQFHQELTGLNPEQLQAVKHKDGPMLVLAGAGSGKTRVATLRIAHLITTGVQPHEILGLTFTNKAAHEMKERVQKYANGHVLVTTFHALGARLLRESIHHLGYSKDFVIYDESDSEKLLKETMREMCVSSDLDPKALRAFISRTKNGLVVEEQEGFKVLYQRYNEKLQKCNAVDFDDLLRLPVELFKIQEVLEYYQSRWKYMLVDEYQDTNGAQYSFVKQLCGSRCNLFVVGDPDQSIYSWRGANIQNILNFEKDFPGAIVVRLEQNYRSTNIILEAANAVITRNGGRYDKSLWSALGDGEKINFYSARSEREEARFVGRQVQDFIDNKGKKLSDICIFYRTNVQSRVLEDEMLSRRLPYTIVGGVSFYLRKEIKDVLSMLRLLDNHQDLISFLRVVNLPKRGIGDTTLEKIVSAQEQSGEPILDFMMRIYAEDAWNELPFNVTAKQKEGWADFAKTFLMLMETSENESLEELVRAAIFTSRYIDVIASDNETKLERLENLEELIVKAQEWEEAKKAAGEEVSLSNFLSDTSLATSMDNADSSEDAITLMTIHNGKGLEFEIAFLVGLEEDLFPHINSKKTPEQVEEERRLFYVGITRAKRHLFISFAQVRSLWGATRSMRPSRFLQEIPQKLRQLVAMSSPPAMSSSVPYGASGPKVLNPLRDENPFSIGEMVFHPQFGAGRVENVREGSHGLMYEVLFSKDDTTKCLIAKIAPLQRLSK